MPPTVASRPTNGVMEKKSSKNSTKETTSSPYQASSNYGPELATNAVPNKPVTNSKTASTNASPYQSSSDYGPPTQKRASASGASSNSSPVVTKPPVRTSSSGSAAPVARKMSTSSTVSTVSMDESIASSGSSKSGNNMSSSPASTTKTGSTNKVDVPITVSTAPPTASSFYLKDHYGLSIAPQNSNNSSSKNDKLRVELEKCYARAICYAIGSGGVYTDGQVNFVKGLLQAKGYEVNDSVDTIFKAASKMVDLELVTEVGAIVEAGKLKTVAPVMLYDMCRTAAVAGFPEEQMCAIALIADEIGVTEYGQLESIKDLVQKEVDLKRERVKMLFPDGHPCLAQEFVDLAKEEESSAKDANNKKK